MDNIMISKQLNEVINQTHILCSDEDIDVKVLKTHKIAVCNLIRGYKNSKTICVKDLEAAYKKVVFKLDSMVG